jgi:hypothetical protein
VGPLVKHQTFNSIPYLFEKIQKNWGTKDIQIVIGITYIPSEISKISTLLQLNGKYKLYYKLRDIPMDPLIYDHLNRFKMIMFKITLIDSRFECLR